MSSLLQLIKVKRVGKIFDNLHRIVFEAFVRMTAGLAQAAKTVSLVLVETYKKY